MLDGAEARAAAGTLEFHDLLVLARRLLATDPGARRRLHERYRRVLLDEFQDTDPIQLEIAVRLTADPAEQPADGIDGVVPQPGRLFVVGDPKQSIYRFRRADIAVYLRAAAQVDATRAVLSANFRSTDGGHRVGQRCVRHRHRAAGRRAAGLRAARCRPPGAA